MAGTPIDQVVQLQGLHVAPVAATTLLTFQTGAGDVFSLDVAPGTQPQSTATDAAQGGTSPTDSARFVTVTWAASRRKWPTVLAYHKLVSNAVTVWVK